MIPGMSKKQLKQMERQMKKMGMNMGELQGVREVVIKLEDKQLVIPNAEVGLMNVAGNETYQVTGHAHEEPYELEIPDDDIEMVASSADVTKEEAKKALEECDGDLAEAIMKLS